jgi:hypothetical protein
MEGSGAAGPADGAPAEGDVPRLRGLCVQAIRMTRNDGGREPAVVQVLPVFWWREDTEVGASMQFRRKLYRDSLPIWEAVRGHRTFRLRDKKRGFLALGWTTVRGTENREAPE